MPDASIDSLDDLLALFPARAEQTDRIKSNVSLQLGFVFDTGQSSTLDRLDFCLFEGWLERLVGAHLHDVIGLVHHYAPGVGEVNFERLAVSLPSTTFRALELRSSNTAKQARNGLKFLAK